MLPLHAAPPCACRAMVLATSWCEIGKPWARIVSRIAIIDLALAHGAAG